MWLSVTCSLSLSLSYSTLKKYFHTCKWVNTVILLFTLSKWRLDVKCHLLFIPFISSVSTHSVTASWLRFWKTRNKIVRGQNIYLIFESGILDIAGGSMVRLLWYHHSRTLLCLKIKVRFSLCGTVHLWTQVLRFHPKSQTFWVNSIIYWNNVRNSNIIIVGYSCLPLNIKLS